MSVRISARALLSMQAAAVWWRENRDKAPELFEGELGRSLELLAFAPLAGAPVRSSRVRNMRVVSLRRTGYLLFYRVDAQDDVRVLELRHGRRKPNPQG